MNSKSPLGIRHGKDAEMTRTETLFLKAYDTAGSMKPLTVMIGMMKMIIATFNSAYHLPLLCLVFHGHYVIYSL